MQVPSPLDLAGKDVTLEFSAATGEEDFASAQSLKHWESSVSNASFRTAPEPAASSSLTRLPTPRGQAITESRERWSGQRDDLINASAYPRPANPAPPTGARFASPPPAQNGRHLQRIPSPQRQHSGRTIAASGHAAPQYPGEPPIAQHAGAANANLPARYTNLRTGTGGVPGRRSGSARMTPPASPYANPSGSPLGARGGPMSSGNLSGPLSGRGIFPAYDGMLSARGMQSTDNFSKSVEMTPGTNPPFHVL